MSQVPTQKLIALRPSNYACVYLVSQSVPVVVCRRPGSLEERTGPWPANPPAPVGAAALAKAPQKKKMMNMDPCMGVTPHPFWEAS